MPRLATSFVLGYHGCDKADGERILAGEPFKSSKNDYDWLGPGIYFWENNPQRGLEFAEEKMVRGGSHIKEPFVIGAIIDLGECLNLMTAESLSAVRVAYDLLKDEISAADTMPKNSKDQLRRKLDCAVINRVHELANTSGATIQTVKGVFVEGKRLYTGSGFRQKTHIQIAVCDPSCIKGVFRVQT